MHDPHQDDLRVLAPITAKPKLDYLHREVQRAAGRRITRRQDLVLGGMAILAGVAAACSESNSSTTSGGSAGSNPLTNQPLESHLEIYKWSQYDAKSTFTDFLKQPAEKQAGMTYHETFYSSNDELLAKLNAGGTSYDIIVPSQNAVAELIQEGMLMRLDRDLLPNLSTLDPSYWKPSS